VCSHAILRCTSPIQISRKSAEMASRYRPIGKTISISCPTAVLNLQNFYFFVKFHVDVASTRYAYLRRADMHSAYLLAYGDVARLTIFNMAAVRHLEFLMTASYCIRNCILCSQLCVKFSRRSVAYTF